MTALKGRSLSSALPALSASGVSSAANTNGQRATWVVCGTMLCSHLATLPASNAAMVNNPPTMYRCQQARFSHGKAASRAPIISGNRWPDQTEAK